MAEFINAPSAEVRMFKLDKEDGEFTIKDEPLEISHNKTDCDPKLTLTIDEDKTFLFDRLKVLASADTISQNKFRELKKVLEN